MCFKSPQTEKHCLHLHRHRQHSSVNLILVKTEGELPLEQPDKQSYWKWEGKGGWEVEETVWGSRQSISEGARQKGGQAAGGKQRPDWHGAKLEMGECMGFCLPPHFFVDQYRMGGGGVLSEPVSLLEPGWRRREWDSLPIPCEFYGSCLQVLLFCTPDSEATPYQFQPLNSPQLQCRVCLFFWEYRI